MTYTPTTASPLRHLLVFDDAVLDAGADTLARLADRIGSMRDEILLVVAGFEPSEPLPQPDYVISGDGGAITRCLTGDTLDEWTRDGSNDVVEATRYLADALMVPHSEIFVVARDTHPLVVTEPGNAVAIGPSPDGDVGAWAPEADAIVPAIDELRLFSRSTQVVSDMSAEAFEAAQVSLRKCVTHLGFTAASLTDNPLSLHDANYAAVWARDGIITGLWALSLEDDEFTDCFRRTVRVLAKHQSPTGQIPANVRLEGEIPDYSGIGGIASIDSVLWFVIGAVRLAFHTGDRAFAEEMRLPVERAMAWLAAHDANNDGLIEIPESSDWMDLFPRSYNVLYDEVLWYQACRDAGSFLDGIDADGSGWSQHAEWVATRIKELFWPSGEQLMELAGSSSGRFSIGEGQYMLSQVTPFDYGWRCDVYANLLASLTGLLDDTKSERLFRFLWGVGINSPFPVRCLYPPIVSGADDWKDYFLVNFLNLPDHYHNGGIWPFIGGLWVRFLMRVGRTELAYRELNALAEACHTGIYGDWEFNEWLHGQTGRPMGKAHQAWSAASYIQAYTSLHEMGEHMEFGPLDPAILAG